MKMTTAHQRMAEELAGTLSVDQLRAAAAIILEPVVKSFPPPLANNDDWPADCALSDVDLNLLRSFHAAAEAGSFTLAGEQLELSQSAVSRQISALESELGVELFTRYARGLIVNERGMELYRVVDNAFKQIGGTVNALKKSQRKANGR
jgi:hypothetical protein